MKHKNLYGVLKEPSVVFDEVAHSYTNKHTGELYTGTTTVSGAWRKDFLAPWHAKEAVRELGFFDPKYDKEFQKLTKPEKAKKIAEAYDRVLKIREEISVLKPEEYIKKLEHAKGAAKRLSELAKDNGKEAHSWVEAFICSKIIDEPLAVKEFPKNEESLNAVRAFSQWETENKHNIEWLASEELVCSDVHRVGGTLDALLNYKSLLTIGDIKTSGQISEDYLLQLAGYSLQLAEMGLQARQWLIIRTPKDGTPVETLTINDPQIMKFARESFLHQREAHRFYVFAENHLKGGEGFSKKMKVDIPTIKVEKDKETKK
jgi:hypothetical protein